MKKYKLALDAILLLGVTIISLLAVAPDAIIMPTSLQMGLLVGVLVLLVGFLVFVWRESPADEREAHNQSLASRYAYLVGALFLVAALVSQSLTHDLDPFIPITLLSMIATKVITQHIKDK